MAKRHSVDDELSGALAILNGIEVAIEEWAPEPAQSPVDIEPDKPALAEVAGQTQQPEPVRRADPDAAAFVASVDRAAGRSSPLVNFIRHLDDEIQRIIAQANDTEILSFHEKLLRRLHLSRTPQDMHRRDGVLAGRLVTVLERAARLIAALDTHRRMMKSQLSPIETDLVIRIEQTKSIGDEAGAIADAAEQLTSRQDVVEAAIRHEADCNSLYHKLAIEAERGIVVLRALTGGQNLSFAEQFSAEARAAFSPLLALSDKGMLSMREVERRKHAVDQSFLHRFNPAPVRRAEGETTTEHTPQTEQAHA
ncbi:hypothetical protein ACRQ1B_03940 [Rhizobium panacihumi]|uniref:hypothetical protein n=1 Tax=Rhizobium panacihumi TaxID=2008450 RepID=UPI003D7952F4